MCYFWQHLASLPVPLQAFCCRHRQGVALANLSSIPFPLLTSSSQNDPSTAFFIYSAWQDPPFPNGDDWQLAFLWQACTAGRPGRVLAHEGLQYYII
jgi:hypothetical protein